MEWTAVIADYIKKVMHTTWCIEMIYMLPIMCFYQKYPSAVPCFLLVLGTRLVGKRNIGYKQGSCFLCPLVRNWEISWIIAQLKHLVENRCPVQRQVFHTYLLIPTCTRILFVSAVLLCFGRSCHHRRGQGDHTHCVWAGERAALSSQGHSNPCPCWGEWLWFFCNPTTVQEQRFFQALGASIHVLLQLPWIAHMKHPVLKQALLLPAVKVRKGLFKGNSLCANNTSHRHHCFNQDNHLSACQSWYSVMKDLVMFSYDDRIFSILTIILY